MPKHPNIILINCDDLGYGDLGPYGSTVNRTPNLDRMAGEGRVFTDFQMASSVCSPSRAALMTGCYPQRVGLGMGEHFVVLMPGDAIGLHPDEITIASHLKQAGYATMLVGKWHLGDQPPFLPTAHGFDHYFGIPFSNDMGVDSEGGRMLRDWGHNIHTLPLMSDEAVCEIEPDQAALTDRFQQQALPFVREHRDQPFFLYFAHMYVHTPLHAPQSYIDRSENGVYGAEIEHLDALLGDLLDELKRLEIDQQTLVIFTSDNGAAPGPHRSNAPLRGSKGTTFEGGHRVPCVMRWPGVIPPGTTCDELATAMDLLPTLGRLAGVEPPTDRIIDGHDIGPLIRGEPNAASPCDAFFYYFRNRLEAVRRGKWKLHVHYDQTAGALYDLEFDVGETTDRAERHPDLVESLMELAKQCRVDLGDESFRWHRGRNCRPAGRVADPRQLTSIPPDHPFVSAAYD